MARNHSPTWAHHLDIARAIILSRNGCRVVDTFYLQQSVHGNSSLFPSKVTLSVGFTHIFSQSKTFLDLVTYRYIQLSFVVEL